MISKIFKELNNNHHLNILYFFIISICLALSDLIGAISLSILVSFLSNSADIFQKKIPFFFEILGQNKKDAFLKILVITSIFFYSSILLRTFYGYQKVKFLNNIKIFIGKKIFRKFLNISFSKFNKYTNAEVQTLLNFESERFSSCVSSVIKINEGLISIIILFISLTFVNLSYIIYFILLGIVFYFSYRLIKPIILENDKILRESNIKMVDTVNETVANIKLIKIQKIFSFFFDKFVLEGIKFSKSRSIHQFMPIFTKNIIEFILFSIFILFIALYLNSSESNIQELLPVITFFLVLAYRLVPSFQTIYTAVVSLYSSKSAIISISDSLKINDEILSSKDEIDFNKEILFKNLNFQYSINTKFIHSNLNIMIKKNTLNVVLGKSGTGKSTLLDLISGLITPTHGEIFIDDNKLEQDNILSWQNKIGFMGQDLVLLNNSVKINIEFGSNKEIKNNDYENLLKLFFDNDEISKFQNDNFLVGERGSQISFGQRQRIILARQFFSDKEVILLDEPTSSLDELNIIKFKDVLKSIKGTKTIILTTHNHSFNDISDQIITL